MRPLSPFQWANQAVRAWRPGGNTNDDPSGSNRAQRSRAVANPDGHARITGPCGDTMEFWLCIEEGRVVEVAYGTDGCHPSILSGYGAARLATGKSVEEAAEVGQQEVLTAIGGLPAGSEHCALLAANTLKAALSDYHQRQQQAAPVP